MPAPPSLHDLEVFALGMAAGALIVLVVVRLMVARIVGNAVRRREPNVLDFTRPKMRKGRP